MFKSVYQKISRDEERLQVRLRKNIFTKRSVRWPADTYDFVYNIAKVKYVQPGTRTFHVVKSLLLNLAIALRVERVHRIILFKPSFQQRNSPELKKKIFLTILLKEESFPPSDACLRRII